MSRVARIQILQLYASNAELRNQDEGERSNAQTVTLKELK
jgi:hypothetical protein